MKFRKLDEAGRVGGNMASGEQQAKAYASPSVDKAIEDILEVLVQIVAAGEEDDDTC